MRPLSMSLALAALSAAACTAPQRDGPTGVGDVLQRIGGAATGAVATTPPAPAGAIAENAGALAGMLRVPLAGLISNHGAGLLSDGGGGLIANHGAGLLSDGGGGYRILGGGYALAGVGQLSVALGGVQVRVRDGRGNELAYGVYTAADGSFRFGRLKASDGLVFVQATLTREGQLVTLAAVAPAPRKAEVRVQIDPAGTLVAKKIRAMIALNALTPEDVRPAAAQKLANALSARLGEAGVVAAALLPDEACARVFDAAVALAPPLAQVAREAQAPNLILTTPSKALPRPPVGPSASTAPGGPAAAGPGSPAGEAALPSATPEPFPEASQEPAGVATPTPEPPLPTPTPGPTAPASVPPTPAPSQGVAATPTPLPQGVVGGSLNKVGTTDGPIGTGQLMEPFDMVWVNEGGPRLLVTDKAAHRVRQLDLATGALSTYLGSGAGGLAYGVGTAAKFNGPRALARAADGMLYMALGGDAVLTKIGPGATLSYLSGRAGIPGIAGIVGESTASESTFGEVHGICVADASQLVMCETNLSRIRVVSRVDGGTKFLAGMYQGYADSPSAGYRLAQADYGKIFAGMDLSGMNLSGLNLVAFKNPHGIVGIGTDLFITDAGNHVVRRMTAGGIVSTLAGVRGQYATGEPGFQDGTGAAVRFNQPTAIVAEGPSSMLVCDTGNHVIRRVTTAGVVTTVIGSGVRGSLDVPNFRNCQLDGPKALALDPAGNLYVADGTGVIRRFPRGY